MPLQKFVLSLLLALQLPLNPPGGQVPVQFHAIADWPLTANDRDWLEHYYLPARWQEARAIVAYVNGVDPPELPTFTVEVWLHPTLFPDSESAQGELIAGIFHPPGASLSFSSTFHVEVAWDRELSQKIPVSHEFCHVLQLASGFAGWTEIGHGTPGDPFLQKILAWARRVYIPSHVYDPFKAGVLQ